MNCTRLSRISSKVIESTSITSYIFIRPYPIPITTRRPLLQRQYHHHPRHPALRTEARLSPLQNPTSSRLPFSTTQNLEMASDEDYMSFLDKANKDVSGGDGGGGGAKATSKQGGGGGHTFKTTDSGAEVPKEIKEATKDAFYVSDADEPFVTVSLKYDGPDGLPDEVEFAKLINHWSPQDSDIEIQTPTDWDRQGQYTKLVKAVQRATKGNDVMVYKVPVDATRVEYWLVSSWEDRVIGVKALAVES